MSLWDRLQRKIGDLAGELALDDHHTQLVRAQRLLAGGDASAAIDTLEALLVDKPDHGPALIVLGEARLASRDLVRAREAFERAYRVRDTDPAVMLGLGLVSVVDGKYDAAVTWLARAVNEAAGDRTLLADAYRGLGLAWRRRGDLDKAIRELRKAVAEDGDDLEARAALGEALIADGVRSGGGEGAFQEALRHLERATAKPDQASATALYGLAKLALVEGSPAIAGQHLARARVLAEQDPTPLGAAIRHDILLAQGDTALAERDAMRAYTVYLEALALDPKRVEVLARIAAAHRSIGNLDAALQTYDRALALGAPLDVLRAALDTAIQAGDATRMLPWSADLMAREPDDLRALVARGAATAMQPDAAAAARALLEIAAGRDDIDAHIALARLELADSPKRAVAAAHAALRIAPHDPRARELLSRARTAELGAPVGDDIAELAKFLEGIAASQRDLGHLVGDIARAAANLESPLLVTVMGEFSSGKSSFVNAFIGADVAPTGITPTTATINVVRYGRERGGRIVMRDGAILAFDWDGLMAHLRVLTPDAARSIDRVEILVPLPQLEKINIVDTPGLNSIQPEHEATARAFMAKADAIVWVFTALQGGKASEKAALRSIRDEGKRVLGVLNKADTLSTSETDEVIAFIGGELGDLVEAVVPFSARAALAWKRAPSAVTGELGARTDGNWEALLASLETRFFQQARQLKRDACARLLRAATTEATRLVEARRAEAAAAQDAAKLGRDELLAAARQFASDGVLQERKALSELTSTLYRRAAREVLDLVRPRRLPFASHTATVADRDYLISLLSSGFETAIEAGRRRVAAELLARSRAADAAARTLGLALGVDVAGDLQRTASDRIGLALSRVFDRTRAYLHGFLEGGYVEAFFRNDVPKLELAEDAVYHALVRGAPDLDRELGEPLGRAATDALSAIADRLAHWGGVADVAAYDLEVGLGHALEIVAARL